MLLKTNWQNLGHGAVGGVWSPPVTGAVGQWLPGLSKGEEEKGEGEAGLSRRVSGDAGNWQADERAQVGGGGSRVRESRNGGTGRSADSGNGLALRKDPGDRTPPRSPHPLRLMYSSTERRDAPQRRNSERGAQGAEYLAYCCDKEINRGIGGTIFCLITFPSRLLFPPPLFFFAFCHIMRLGATNVISVGALGLTHVLPGARDAGQERSADCCRNAERVLGKRGVSWEWGGCRAALRNGGAAPFPSGPCVFKCSPLRRGRGVGRWAQPPALSVTQGNGPPAERSWQPAAALLLRLVSCGGWFVISQGGGHWNTEMGFKNPICPYARPSEGWRSWRLGSNRTSSLLGR